MFSKRAKSAEAVPPAPAPPPPPPPPKLVKFDTDETRAFVLDILEVEAPKDGVMRIRLGSKDGWQELKKQSFETRFRMSEITYSAWNSAEFGKWDEYFPKLSCRLTCRPFGHTTPLVVFLPDPPEETNDLPDPAQIYTCQFRDVSISPALPDPKVIAGARVHVELWDNEDGCNAYLDALLDEWQQTRETDAPREKAWPDFQLNTASSRWRSFSDRLPLDSYLHLHPTVFEGLRRDVFALGQSAKVEITAVIEAYTLERSRNYAPEYGDGDFFAKLVLIPYGSVLSARFKELKLSWREGGTDFDSGFDPPVQEPSAPTLDGIATS